MIIFQIAFYTIIACFLGTLLYPMIILYKKRINGESKSKIGKKILTKIALTILIVILPVSIFLLSSLLTPWSKEESTFGYWDMLMETKYVLLPFVLWAVAALYAIEVLKVKKPDQYWILLGLLTGLVTSILINIYGYLLLITQNGWDFIGMLVFTLPYVPVWYFVRFKHLVKSSHLKPVAYLYALISQLPFWYYAIHTAKQEYILLPDLRSDCFVATASANGYRAIVGDTLKYTRKDRSLNVSKQMITFWKFEDLWIQASPRTHHHFRTAYNIVGKHCSKYIRTPMISSVFFILLKPLEWIAKLFI